MSHDDQPLRRIPKVDRLLTEPAVLALIEAHGRTLVLDVVRGALEELRSRARLGALPLNGAAGEEFLAAALDAVTSRLATTTRPSLRRQINATGVVLHTGLGRAVLSEAARAAVAEVCSGHSLLELDAESGERGSRHSHIAPLLKRLTGAEDGIAVNNNAAAVFLAVSALAMGRDVVISRGQLVEIGGSFRIPDVIRSAGARLVEVGATNKTRISDYAAAITPETALILRVHPSNFKIVGFTEEPALAELVSLCASRGIPVLDDLGSGALVPLGDAGLSDEPTVQDSVCAGADVITFSGDKLLGGPQAGLVIGKSALIARLKSHPLMRVVRLDKMTLAALEATLREYLAPDRALEHIPTLRALTEPLATIRLRADRLAGLLSSMPLQVSLVEGESQVGGGSLPGEELPTWIVQVESDRASASELARTLRVGDPGVWVRVHRERLCLDVRTVTDAELTELAEAMRRALARIASESGKST